MALWYRLWIFNDNSIKQVITAGARHWDTYIRLELAGVPEEKIVHTRNELDSTKNLNIKDVDTVFILYDIYTIHLMNQIKKDVEKWQMNVMINN